MKVLLLSVALLATPAFAQDRDNKLTVKGVEALADYEEENTGD